MSGAIIDVIALALILIFTVVGAIRGFAKTFISSFGTIISILLAILLASLVANFLQSTFGLSSTIGSSLSGVLTNMFGDQLMNTTLNQATQDNMSSLGLTAWLIKIILSVKGDGNVPMDTTLNEIICPVFAHYIVIVLSVIILFILFKVIFFLIGETVKKLREFKLVKRTDCILGCIMGLIKGIMALNLILLIIPMIPLGFCQEVVRELSNAPLTNFFNNVNFISIIINAITNPASIVSGIFGA